MHRGRWRLAIERVSGPMDGQFGPLPVGAVASDLTMSRTLRARLTLRSLHGQPVVVVFYPMDWEPVSGEQLALYQEYGDEFDHFGALLLGVSVDHAYSHEAFARDAQIHFPLLADFQPRGAVARRYGVYREVPGVSARALFVLDERRVVRFSKTYPDLLNPGVDDLLTTLEALEREREQDARRRKGG